MSVRVTLHQTTSCDPLEWENVWVWIPSGCGRILSGRVKEGDLALDHRVWQGRRSINKGYHLEQPPLWVAARPNREADSLYRKVEAWTCVIRKGVPSETPCERCLAQPRFKGDRYCVFCGRIIVARGRRGL